MGLQALTRLIYPPSCIACAALVETDFGLCPSCWLDTPFISGVVCDACGCDLPGSPDPQMRVLCDDCLRHLPPWTQGRAALRYEGTARGLVMALKHADRLDLAKPMGRWMAQSVMPILQPDTILVPIPLHWRRLLKRKANQSSILAQQVGKITGHHVIPDLLQRPKATSSLDHLSRASRRAELSQAFRVHPKRLPLLEDRPVILVDDVMTTGATLAAATLCLHQAGVKQVSVLVLCRTNAPDFPANTKEFQDTAQDY